MKYGFKSFIKRCDHIYFKLTGTTLGVESMEYPQWREYLTVLEVMCEELDTKSLAQSSLKDMKSDLMEDEAEESEDGEENEDGASSNVQDHLITDFFKGSKETDGKQKELEKNPNIRNIQDIPSIVSDVKLDIDAALFMKYQRLSRLFKRKKNQMVCRVGFVDFQTMCKYLTLIVEHLEEDIHSKNAEDAEDASDVNEEISEEDVAEMQEECKDLEDYTAEIKQEKPKRKRKDKPGWLITDDESDSSSSDGKKRKRIRRP